MNVNDKVSKDGNGFYRIDTVLASAGVMSYPQEDGTVKVAYMPEEEIQKALTSFAGLPLTNDHPTEGVVTPANYKDLAVGYVDRDLKFENGRVIGSTVVCSEEGIEAVKGQKTDVSIGYSESQDHTPGVFVDEHNVMGQGSGKEYKYDYRKTDIKLNHLALCDEGRSKAAQLVLDSNYTYSTKVVLDSNNFKGTSTPDTIDIMTEKQTQLIIGDQVINVNPENVTLIRDMMANNTDMSAKIDSMMAEKAALESKLEALSNDLEAAKNANVMSDELKGELEALKAIASTDSQPKEELSLDQVAVEATARLSTWNQINALSKEDIAFDAAKPALEIKRSFIADNYEVENVADASEAFLDGMLQVIAKTSVKTVSKVADSAKPAPMSILGGSVNSAGSMPVLDNGSDTMQINLG